MGIRIKFTPPVMGQISQYTMARPGGSPATYYHYIDEDFPLIMRDSTGIACAARHFNIGTSDGQENMIYSSHHNGKKSLGDFTEKSTVLCISDGAVAHKMGKNILSIKTYPVRIFLTYDHDLINDSKFEKNADKMAESDKKQLGALVTYYNKLRDQNIANNIDNAEIDDIIFMLSSDFNDDIEDFEAEPKKQKTNN